jgi:hypothetical protein
LSTNTDDDDISVFVQDIDSRKPLSGRLRTLEQDTTQDQDQDSNTREGGNEYSIHHSGLRDGGSAEGSSQGPILTNERESGGTWFWEEGTKIRGGSAAAAIKRSDGTPAPLGWVKRRRRRRRCEQQGQQRPRWDAISKSLTPIAKH